MNSLCLSLPVNPIALKLQGASLGSIAQSVQLPTSLDRFEFRHTTGIHFGILNEFKASDQKILAVMHQMATGLFSLNRYGITVANDLLDAEKVKKAFECVCLQQDLPTDWRFGSSGQGPRYKTSHGTWIVQGDEIQSIKDPNLLKDDYRLESHTYDELTPPQNKKAPAHTYQDFEKYGEMTNPTRCYELRKNHRRAIEEHGDKIELLMAGQQTAPTSEEVLSLGPENLLTRHELNNPQNGTLVDYRPTNPVVLTYRKGGLTGIDPYTAYGGETITSSNPQLIKAFQTFYQYAYQKMTGLFLG